MRAVENPADLTTADKQVLASALEFYLAGMARNATMEGHGLYDSSRGEHYLGFVVTHIAGDPFTRVSFDQVFDSGALRKVPFFQVVGRELENPLNHPLLEFSIDDKILSK